MTTLAVIAKKSKNRLDGSFRPVVSSLAADIAANATTFTLTSTPTEMAVGAVVCIDTELYYVTGWDTGTRVVLAVPGYSGSTSALHTAGSIVEVNHRFPTFAVYEAVVDELRGIPVSVPAVYTATVSVGNGQYIADLTVADPRFTIDAYGLLEVQLDKPDDGQYFQAISGSQQPIRWVDYVDGRLIKDAGHLSLRLARGLGVQWISANLHVTIASPVITTGVTPASDLTTFCGLADSMVDVITLGVWLRLLGDQEAKRSARGPAGESRRPEEVPAGLIMSDVTNRRREYTERLMNEAFKIRARYPIQVAS